MDKAFRSQGDGFAVKSDAASILELYRMPTKLDTTVGAICERS